MVEGDLAEFSIPVSTLGVVFLLGPAVVLWVYVEALHWTAGNKFGTTVLEMLRCCTILAGVLCFCFVAEHAWYAEKAEKFYSPGMYWGLFGVLVVVSLLTLRKCPSTDFMNRDQTEEWKGWMQFLFIQYHYWKMETAYKDIRVYITCYLWMTGFGNVSFFYTKQDYSLLRVLQMVWRMNFFVFFLCLTMDNAYIVYYICPLHTFFFMVSYFTMGIWSSVNHTQYGTAFKIAACAVLFYIFYDAVPQIFHPIFQWLGTESTHAPIGGHGVEWEWYFRSFLDHFSTIWGMVFALNMPYLAEWFKRVESLSFAREWSIKLSMVAVMAVMFGFWVHYVYSRDKLDYNAVHSFYGIVPLLSYLLLRNISKTMRGYYLHGLHWFGTITLECYLLQYHIWLSDNAAKLLNWVPGHWFLTFIIATCFHLVCSQAIFNITTKLRDIVLPNNLGVALRNLIAVLAGVLVSYGIAYGFILHGMQAAHLVWIIGVLSVLHLGALHCLHSDKDQHHPESMWGKVKAHTNITVVQLVYFALFLVGLVVLNSFLRSDRWHRHHAPLVTAMYQKAVDGEVFFSSIFSGYEFQESFNMGRVHAFVIGSLAQKWHGLVATLAIIFCLAVGDSYFGLGRLFLYIFAPEGSKTIPWDEVYAPLIEKLNKPKSKPGDAEAGRAPSERTPLVTS